MPQGPGARPRQVGRRFGPLLPCSLPFAALQRFQSLVTSPVFEFFHPSPTHTSPTSGFSSTYSGSEHSCSTHKDVSLFFFFFPSGLRSVSRSARVTSSRVLSTFPSFAFS